MLHWQQAAGKRHALDGPVPNEGGTFTTLCGNEVTVRRTDVIELGGDWLDPTCVSCDSAWRAR
ncbi:MAG: hypothetical protein JWQ81_1052 [Amycolatopsis sp.]|uniref:zinc finger protein n=1 Tax=Amycolatopsis sp. TaxID=37632 RepID=UPI0026239252|nr:zinc finger protein [Amycolatopsis sp.]MCU1680313.1 hypothetical protein [Amycolatopsis sp.]